MAALHKAPEFAPRSTNVTDPDGLFVLDIEDFLFDDLVEKQLAGQAAAAADSYLTDEALGEFEDIEIIETDAAGFEIVTEPVTVTHETAMSVDIIHLVRPNTVFLGMINALGITDEEARLYLCDAMREAGTSPDSITPEDLWFMLPRIETEVIARYADQDSSVRRDTLREMLRRLRYAR